MRKTLLAATISTLMVTIATPTYAVQGSTLDQRVKRLERMMENPVLLQLSRRLGEQQRDIQNLQDENDRLKREIRQLRTLMDKRYSESDERLSVLEGGQPRATTFETPAMPVAPVPSITQPTMAVETVSGTGAQTGASGTTESVQEPAVVTDTPATLATQSETTVTAPVVDIAQEQVAEVAPALENAEPPAAKQTVSQAELGPIKTRTPTEIEKEKYKAAFGLMRQSRYSESIEAFQSFINDYPESELASNAAYWAGEGYLIQEKNEAALDSFLTVLNRYPNSPKVPDATLRAGDSYERLGQSDKAVELYKEIIKTRPHSRAAKNAQKRLEK